MKPQSTIPARNTRTRPPKDTQHANRRSQKINNCPRQQTLWGFIRQQLHPSGSQPSPTLTVPDNTPDTTANPVTPINTPPMTPLLPASPSMSQTTRCDDRPRPSRPQQRPLQSDRSNDPWGDCWALRQPTNLFRILSKNTGTINLHNLDFTAITKELTLLSASVFSAQETNVHWNEETISHLRAQCRRANPQTRLATSTSAEKASNWFKPGGTITMALNQWTGRVINNGTDPNLGRWSYLEFIGKHDKRLIVMSGYRVCNQPFDAASQTVTAQQIRLLQAHGTPNPKPRTIFINDLIQLVRQWRLSQKEIILCMDANDPIDDPKAEIAHLFQETDLTDLHYHKYPGLRKPATQQRGSKAIDLIAGSPLVAAALVHAWICPFGDPAAIKGDHRLLGVDLDPDILFGHAIALPAMMSNRGVNSRQDQKVTKFCKRVISQCNQHQLAERIAQLQSLQTLGTEDIAELERIDEQITKILLSADHCQPMNSDPWSPELNQAYL